MRMVIRVILVVRAILPILAALTLPQVFNTLIWKIIVSPSMHFMMKVSMMTTAIMTPKHLKTLILQKMVLNLDYQK